MAALRRVLNGETHSQPWDVQHRTANATSHIGQADRGTLAGGTLGALSSPEAHGFTPTRISIFVV
jgi:hypothetical protein